MEHFNVQSPSPWSPLESPLFRNLLIADFVSDVGTFLQSVGAAWLMTSLTSSSIFIALIQTASALPFFLLALPAGSIGDICDRRKLILGTELWMVGLAIFIAVTTITHTMTPWLLLLLTFGLSAGDAIESPSWRAIFPELVSRESLAPALALNGIEFNLARAVGPGLAGLIIAVAGIGTAFVLNVFSFVGVIWVIAGWKRPRRKNKLPAETLTGATRAALRYVRYSPDIIKLLFRSACVIFFASAFWALLPAVAKNLSESSVGYGLLLGCFGGGAAWTAFMSVFNTLIQKLAPDWVRARVLAIYLLIFQGSIALGSALWGVAADHTSANGALMFSSAGILFCLVLPFAARLPEAKGSLEVWNHWGKLAMFEELEPDEGPVLVAVEYKIDPVKESEFLEAIHDYERIRRRDGAVHWGIYYDTEISGVYMENFVVDSWAEHARQHDRFTMADRESEDRVLRFVLEPIKTRHFLYAHRAERDSRANG